MRRSIIFTSIMAAMAVLGACSGTATNNTPGNNINVKPAATASPVSTASPVASPAVSPSASPDKPGASPEVKKDDKNTNVKVAETPKK